MQIDLEKPLIYVIHNSPEDSIIGHVSSVPQRCKQKKHYRPFLAQLCSEKLGIPIHDIHVSFQEGGVFVELRELSNIRMHQLRDTIHYKGLKAAQRDPLLVSDSHFRAFVSQLGRNLAAVLSAKFQGMETSLIKIA